MGTNITDYEQYYVLLSHNMVELPANAPKWETLKGSMKKVLFNNAVNYKQFNSNKGLFASKGTAAEIRKALNDFAEVPAGKTQTVYDGLATYAKALYAAATLEENLLKFYNTANPTAEELNKIAGTIKSTMDVLSSDMPGVIMIPGISGITEITGSHLAHIDIPQVIGFLKAYTKAVNSTVLGTYAENVAKVPKDMLWANVVCTPDPDLPDEDIDMDDITEDELNDEEETKPEEEETTSAKEENDDDSEAELLARWRKANWTGIESKVDSLLATLETLYKSGIESLPAVGILINNGADKSPLISAKTLKQGNDVSTTIVNEIDSGSRFDLKIMNVMAKSLDSLNFMDGIDEKTGFPTYEALMSNKGVMRNAHLMFQTASIPFSGHNHNKNSIRKWISATKGMSSDEWLKKNNNGKVTTLCKWSDVKAWYRWVIENTLFRYFTAAGLTPESTDLSCGEITEKIADTFIAKMKNVVSVSERVSRKSRMETTELKIATDKSLDIAKIAEDIALVLNTGNAKDITCNARMLTNQVFSLTIVYDQAAANKATKFAAEVIDTIIASGNTPSWDNVLIGRKQSGDLLFWNFMDVPDGASCSYAIYAGSGAGKGNLTLTLMAAALADGRQLFYTDGKPDSGGSIAALAWKAGKEAYMFDGQPKGTGSSFPGILEEHPVVNGMRSIDEITKYSSAIPIGIFNEGSATMFLGVCRYLRSLELCIRIINARGAYSLPKDNWQVWVFDEMTAMSANEITVRKAMGTYISNKGYGNCFSITKATKEKPNNGGIVIAYKPGDKLEEAKQADAGIAYICDWLKWTGSIIAEVPNLVKIALRQAEANIFLIFQKADWLEEHAGLTTISMFATALDCRKIVGSNGLANGCGQYGDGHTLAASWYTDYVAKGTGWWAMSNVSDLRKAGDAVEVIKPYSIWGYRKQGDTTSPAENFFDYYVDKLSVVCKQSVADTLQNAFDYADAAVKQLGTNGVIIAAPTLKDYIYNVGQFSVDGADFDPSTLNEKLKNSGIEGLADHTSDYNSPVTEGSDILVDSDIPVDSDISVDSDILVDSDIPVNTPQGLGGTSVNPFDQLGQKVGDMTPDQIINMERNPNTGANGLNTVSRDELRGGNPLQARDNATATSRNEQGENIINDQQVRPDNVRNINDSNCVFTDVQINNSVFQTNNLRKITKALDNAWERLLKTIVRQVGGKGAVRLITMNSEQIYVNGKLVSNGCLNNEFISSFEDIAYMPDIFRLFPALVEIRLTTPLLDLLNEQLDDFIVKVSVKAGKELSLPEYLFKAYPNLALIIDISQKNQIWRRRDLLNSTKDRSARIKEQMEEQKARKEQGNVIQRIRNNYNTKHNGGTPDKKEQLKRARSATKKKKYRGGVVGWLAWHSILKHL